MINIALAPLLKPTISTVKLHCIKCSVVVKGKNSALWSEIESRIELVQKNLMVPDIAELPPNKYTRIAYKSLGKDPSRYRPSAEALLRRALKEKGLYQVNNVVDIINLVSVSSGYSIGGYDRDKIQGEIILKKGGTESYQAIGRGKLNIEGLPVLYDEKGPFGSPTSDSQRTSVDLETSNLLLVFFDFQPQADFDKTKMDTIGLLQKYADADNIDYQMIDG